MPGWHQRSRRSCSQNLGSLRSIYQQFRFGIFHCDRGRRCLKHRKLLCTISDTFVEVSLFGLELLLFGTLCGEVTLSLFECGGELSDVHLAASLGGLPFLILELGE